MQNLVAENSTSTSPLYATERVNYLTNGGSQNPSQTENNGVDLNKHRHRRKVSLTQVEECFLRALLLEPEGLNADQKRKTTENKRVLQEQQNQIHYCSSNSNFNSPSLSLALSDETLFTVPDGTRFGQTNFGNGSTKEPNKFSGDDDPTERSSVPPAPPTTERGEDELRATTSGRLGRLPRRPSISGLWKAHECGVSSKELCKRGNLNLLPPSFTDKVHIEMDQDVSLANNGRLDGAVVHNKKLDEKPYGLAPLGQMDTVQEEVVRKETEEAADAEDDMDVASDVEVRHESKEEDVSLLSSWGDDDHMEHFDAWEVLRDEYACDFGFDFSPKSLSLKKVLADEALPNSFHILGTSASDPSVEPHVLSPPLMDTLMNSLPEQLRGENYWLRFSLARDGCSLETLKSYIRGSKYTVIAVETSEGEVFGSFTSSPWRNALGFFGSTPAFVWRMRHSRRKKVASLYDQAQLESLVDTYSAPVSSHMVQVCRRDGLAVGGDEAIPSVQEFDDIHAVAATADSGGFAFTLDSDLLRGTTSPSSTFGSPSLCGPKRDKSHVFEIAGVEVWTFTPCTDVDAATKLEMTKMLVEGSTRHASHHRSSSSSFGSASSYGSSFSSRDLDVKKFYQRVGNDREGDERRQRWQQTDIKLDTVGAIGRSPRFY